MKNFREKKRDKVKTFLCKKFKTKTNRKYFHYKFQTIFGIYINNDNTVTPLNILMGSPELSWKIRMYSKSPRYCGKHILKVVDVRDLKRSFPKGMMDESPSFPKNNALF